MTDTTPLPAVRPATIADLPAITAIYAWHVRHGTASFETEAPDLADMTRRHNSVVSAGYPYLVAEHAGTVVGYAYAGPYHTRAAYRDTVEDSIYLHPDMTGRGIGGALLAALLDACTARGFRQMVAVVGDSDNLPSVRLHERHGFRNAGTLHAVGYKHGRWLDIVLLQRPLGDGDATPPSRGA
ncbi:GNAT family N-acetyltransferase [Gluconacetobacter tumulisoli]|uniref:N-acetyltransferase n=1 Tax=Gluconacetobacter tumulisoli TaxID=1286189 RepID=A0A7W4K5S0_9PROT|nr:GNAT family N-acetyltransferase [Gluconacetobacter tumulisoli]MBB2200924.1 N-acetyltransferase [Gluconacetobacter tumulisoli]